MQDIPTQRALRALERAINDTSEALDNTITGVASTAGVTSVTAGSAMVTCAPTTGAVVVNVVPANFSGIPQSAVTNLVSDLAARPTGSGTTGRSARWTGTTALGNGAFTDDGTNVSLGGTLTLTPMTSGSVLFAGSGGLVSQDNTAFFWDNSSKGLIVTSPSATAIGAKSNSTSAGTMFIQNTNVSGPSDFYATDNAGTAKISFGYGNGSYSDGARAGRGYLWRNTSVNFVFARTGAVDAMLFSNGNLNIGSTTSDPSVKLRVEGAFTGTGNCVFGTNDTNRHTSNGGLDCIDALGATFAGLDSLTASPLAVWDSTAQATGTGGGILFVGKYTNAGSYAGAAGIKMMKTNGTDGNYSFDLVLGTRPNGGSLTERMRITDAGNVSVQQNLAVNGNATLGDAVGDSHTVNGSITVADDGSAVAITSTPSASTADVIANSAVLGGTFNTTSAPCLAVGVRSSVTSTRSAGANNLFNIAGLFTATGGQNNKALQTDDGDVQFNGNSGKAILFRNTELGNGASNTHTVLGTVAVTHSPSAATASVNVLGVQSDSTYNTTGGALNATAVRGVAIATRSAGANNLINRGGWFDASGAQVNYAVETGVGDVYLNSASGTVGINTPPVSGAKLTVATTTTSNAIAATSSGNSFALNVTRTGSGVTSSRNTANIIDTGSTFNISSPASNVLLNVAAAASKSGGAGTLTNYALALTAVAADVNVALLADQGDVILNNTNGTTTVKGAATFTSTVSIEGNATIGNAGGDSHTVNGALDCNNTLNVDGNVTLNANVTVGDGSADTHTLNGNLTASNTPTAGWFKYGSLNGRLKIGQQIFTSGGTYTPATGTKAVRIRMVGGGGGGGGAGNSGGAGGGGGSGLYWEKWIDPAANVAGGTVTIGAAGSAGSSSGGTGGTGGDTSVVIQSTTYTTKGGTGGAGANSGSLAEYTGGSPATGETSGADVIAGENGISGLMTSGPASFPGDGGGGPMGLGGRAAHATTAAGGAGRGLGAGGGGANAGGGGAGGFAGGAGTAGQVIIEEFA